MTHLGKVLLHAYEGSVVVGRDYSTFLMLSFANFLVFYRCYFIMGLSGTRREPKSDTRAWLSTALLSGLYMQAKLDPLGSGDRAMSGREGSRGYWGEGRIGSSWTGRVETKQTGKCWKVM